MIHEFHKPIPVVVKDESDKNIEGYALYVESCGQFENDVWCVVLNESGLVRHFNTSQIRIQKNLTFNINKHGQQDV